MTPQERQAWKLWKAKALASRWIAPSTSRHSCGFMFVPKKDGTLRFVINYRPLNAIIKPRVYAPRVDSGHRQMIARSRWFSKIDLEDAFYHIRLWPNDTWKTAFRSPDGLFEMLVLPQGLSTSPGEFQLYIEEILAGLLGDSVTVHIDDILIHTLTKSECADLTKAVSARLHKHALKWRKEKCSFVVQEVSYCGHRYGAGRYIPEDRAETIRSWPSPRNQTELRGFLGLANQFHGHVARYAHFAQPLYRNTGKTFKWIERDEEAFKSLKKALCGVIAMSEHDESANATITSDASLFALGGVLSQKGKITAITSRVLTPAERNYDTADRELLAVVHCLKKWVHLVENAPKLLVKTDNMINATRLEPTSTNRRRNRWIELVSKYRITWHHVKGIDNIADLPSRRPDYRKYLKGGEGHVSRKAVAKS